MYQSFIDFETGSLDKRTTPVLSVSIIVDEDCVTVGRYNSLVKPYDVSLVEEKALEVNGLTLEQLECEKDEAHVFAEMVMFLSQYVDLKKRNERIFFTSHNSDFDDGVFRGMLYRNAGDKHLRSKIFWGNCICTQALASSYLMEVRHTMSRFRLSDIAEKIIGKERLLEISGDIGFHDAEVDAEVCREIFYAMREGGSNGSK